MGKMDGRVALISGGARGMGATHARTLVREGARVVIGDVLDGEGQDLAADLGDSCYFTHLDVTSSPDWETAVEAAVTTFGGLDVLVNNAGILDRRNLSEETAQAWNRIFEVNLTGAFQGIKAAMEPLKDSGTGSVVNISSIAGLTGFAGMAAYNASKWGLRGLTKTAALELARYNIRVNSVHPGAINTSMSSDSEVSTAPIPLRRLGTPEEISRLVLFLASTDSSFSTGAEFVADGGETAGPPQP